MIAIEKLRYVRLGVADLRKTADFATRIVGLQQVKSADGTATFRSDYRDHTLELYQNNVRNRQSPSNYAPNRYSTPRLYSFATRVTQLRPAMPLCAGREG